MSEMNLDGLEGVLKAMPPQRVEFLEHPWMKPGADMYIGRNPFPLPGETPTTTLMGPPGSMNSPAVGKLINTLREAGWTVVAQLEPPPTASVSR